jgi:hypothetical protein
MSDPITTARTAREQLARGLNALQSDPNVPPQLLELAAPIAQSMGALHQIERSQGTQLAPHADVALSNVRQALQQLQAQPAVHPAVNQAMEAVAASLALVHALSKLAAQGAGAPQVRQARAQPAPAQAQQPPPAAPPHFGQGFAQQPPAPAPQRAPSSPQFPPGNGAPPARGVDPFGARPGGAPPGPSIPVPAPPIQGNMQVVPADLGAHSATNFYKGLSGNDIVDHGGLFVSTYMIPKIGTPVRLKVALPGGYEFEANAVVRWSREQSEGSDAPPGFGAQFTQITPEARQLVYRYVRNREPLFHDDM